MNSTRLVTLRHLMALTCLPMVMLTGCGSGEPEGAAKDLFNGMNDGELSDLRFEPDLLAGQAEKISTTFAKCPIDMDTVEVLPTNTTPQAVLAVAVAKCEGKEYGVVVPMDSSADKDGNWSALSQNLPGGQDWGKYPGALPASSPISKLKPLQ